MNFVFLLQNLKSSYLTPPKVLKILYLSKVFLYEYFLYLAKILKIFLKNYSQTIAKSFFSPLNY